MADLAAASRLAHDFVERHPTESSDHLESVSDGEAAELLAAMKPATFLKAFRALSTARALAILKSSDLAAAANLVVRLPPSLAGVLLRGFEPAARKELLARLPARDAAELSKLLAFPETTAGSLMDPRIAAFRHSAKVGAVLARLRTDHSDQTVFNVFAVDDEGRLSGVVSLHRAALADPEATLDSVIKSAPVTVSPFAPRSQVVEIMQSGRVTSVPVVSVDGAPIGVLRLNELMQEVSHELSSDLVSMTGASAEERALSSVGFAVKKRLPWLQINLVTAFVAAAVVGIFEETISKFTALAVLLPVVAGQSGNTGSQALAVVLRGLAVQEITSRSVFKVAVKELFAGAINGFGVGAVCSVSVYAWSRSFGLALVIGVAMVAAMAIAGVAGAVIPVFLTVVGKDPAQASSILLTTVTDVVGFLSFLGLATIFADLL
ncbi:MAG: magnesium transporter [Acidobacteriota bacterium]|nr:magnesium transporter [Acidobacteriota bacterium]